MANSKPSTDGSNIPPKSAKETKLAALNNLNKLWKELVQKQRVHEMIKCLQAEKEKLQILHNIEPDSDFLEFAAQQNAAKSEGRLPSDSTSTGESKDRKSKDADGTGSGTNAATEEKDTLQRSRSNLETQSSSKFDVPNFHRHMSYNAHMKSAAQVLSNKRDLTDQEFEDIIELCEDKIEQKALREAFEEKKSRERYLQNASEARVMLYNFINSKFFVNFMLVTIITSIVGIFLLTFEEIAVRYVWPLIMLDSCIIGIFMVEAILKIAIYTEDYFLQLWNLLDMLIIIVHFVEVAVDLVTRTLALSTDINANIGFKFLKSLRALRLLRVIKFLPNLQLIVTTVFQSMLSIGSIAVLMLLFMFVFAVMGRGLFYERSPNQFGNLWLSFVTLFQLLTLDDWFELLETTIGLHADEEEFAEAETDERGYWLMFGYLFAYLVIEYFVFLNLFVAVLVDNFQLTLADAEIQKQKEDLEVKEAQKKFEEMKSEGIDPSITEAEHQKHKSELEQLGMHVDEYFPVDKNSREAELLSEFFKDLNSLDFERFLWKRRFTLFNMITDTALQDRIQNSLVSEIESDDEEDPSNSRPSRDSGNKNETNNSYKQGSLSKSPAVPDPAQPGRRMSSIKEGIKRRTVVHKASKTE